MLRIVAVIVPLLLVLPRHEIAAQSADSTLPLQGRKIRLRLLAPLSAERQMSLEIRGTGISLGRDSIVMLDEGGNLHRVPLSLIRSADEYVGKNRLRGAGRGALLGAGIGLVGAAAFPIDCDDHGHGIDCLADGRSPSRASYVFGAVVSFAFAGATWGAVVGVPQWRRLVEERRVGIATRANSLGLRIAF